MSEKKISYLNKNFDDYKKSLLEISKQYYGDIFNNFNDASIGSWFVDMFADIADNLSYHIDRTYQETNINSAGEAKSVFNIARSQGVKIPGPKSAIVEVEISCELPLLTSETNQRLADERYAPYIKKGTLFSTGTTIFELDDNVDFKKQFDNNGFGNRIIIPKKDSNGNIIGYIYKKLAIAKSGQSKIYKKIITDNDIKPFMSILLTDKNILNVESIILKDSSYSDLNTDPPIEEFFVDKEEFSSLYSNSDISVKDDRKMVKRFFEVDNLAEQYRFGIDYQGMNDEYNPTYYSAYSDVKYGNYNTGAYILYDKENKSITNYTEGEYISFHEGSGGISYAIDEKWAYTDFIPIYGNNKLSFVFADDDLSENKGKSYELYGKRKENEKIIGVEYPTNTNRMDITIDGSKCYYIRYSFRIDKTIINKDLRFTDSYEIYSPEKYSESTLVPRKNWGYSDYIKVNPNSTIIWKPYDSFIQGDFSLDEYDSKKVRIKGNKSSNIGDTEIKLDSKTEYIRASFSLTQINNVYIKNNIGEVIWKPIEDNGDGYIVTENVTKGKWNRVKNKFITEFTNNWALKVTFGAGLENNYGEIPNDASLFTQYMMSRMEANDYMGVLPKPNNTMYILYRVGGGEQTNIAKNTLNYIVSLNMDIDGVPCIGSEVNMDDINKKNSVKNSIKVTNTSISYGGKDAPSIEELKYYIKCNIGEKNRCVTLKDYESRIMNLPPKFGTPFRCSALEQNNKICIYTLGLDYMGNLTNLLSETVSNNIKEYLERYRMINDFVEIYSGKIYNIAFEVDLFIDKTYDRNDVMRNTIETIYGYMDIKKHLMGEDIFLGDLEKEISKIDGVINLIELRCYNKVGNGYSNDEMTQPFIDDINEADKIYERQIDLKSSDKILYSDKISMFEIKSMYNDIKLNVKIR